MDCLYRRLFMRKVCSCHYSKILRYFSHQLNICCWGITGEVIGTAISHYLSVEGSYFGESYDIRIWTKVRKNPWENVDEGVGNCGVCDCVCCVRLGVSVVWVWDGVGVEWYYLYSLNQAIVKTKLMPLKPLPLNLQWKQTISLSRLHVRPGHQLQWYWPSKTPGSKTGKSLSYLIFLGL